MTTGSATPPQARPPAPAPTAPRAARPAPAWRLPWLPYRLTAAGLVYFAVTAFVLVATINSGTNLLYFAFGLTFGAFFLSLLFSHLSLRRIVIHRQFGEHVVAGEPADVEYLITNRKWFWPAMAVRFEEINPGLADTPGPAAAKPGGAGAARAGRGGFILHIPRRGAVTAAAQLVPRRRGVLRLSTVRLTSSFPFGFFARVVHRQFPQEMVVYPRIGMLNRHLALQYRESIESGTMTSNVRGGNDEFYGLREYRAGDNIRAIHWRSSAKSRQLMIREMAANAPPQMIVVLNLRTMTAADRDAAERAIELAASLICYGFYENFAVGLAIAGVDADAPPAPTMGRDARAVLLRRLAVLDPAAVDPGRGIVYPNRLAGRAEWIVITLRAADPVRDLLGPAGISSSQTTFATGAPRSGHHTVLAVDAPDAHTWVHFLSGDDTLRLLRERTADG